MLTPAECLESTATEYGSSRLGEWQRCQRGYHLRYHLKLQPRAAAGQLRIGSIVHGCLRWVNQHALEGREAPGGWPRIIAEAERQADADPASAPWDEVLPTDEAYRLVAGYYAKWGGGRGGDAAGAGWPSDTELVAAEVPLNVDLGYGLIATGRADLIVNIAGTIHVVDYKTRRNRVPGDPGSPERAAFIRGAATGEEFLRLSAAVQQALQLPEPPPVILDAIVKTKLPGYERVVLPITARAVEIWRANADAVGAAMSAEDFYCTNPPTRPRPPVGADVGPMSLNECAPWHGGRCWAFDWCWGSDEQRALRFRKESAA